MSRPDADRTRRDERDEELVDESGRNATQRQLDEELERDGDGPVDESRVTREDAES